LVTSALVRTSKTPPNRPGNTNELLTWLGKSLRHDARARFERWADLGKGIGAGKDDGLARHAVYRRQWDHIGPPSRDGNTYICSPDGLADAACDLIGITLQADAPFLGKLLLVNLDVAAASV
jgi:hypothetical protein